MYAGNSVVVNILMRWPVLIPIALATTIVKAIPTPAADPPKMIITVQEPAPVVVPELKFEKATVPHLPPRKRTRG